jgi:rod shape-determining protein MreD
MLGHPALRYLIVLVTGVVFQRAVCVQFDLDGTTPDVLLVLAIAAGIVGGTERGAIVGFFAGMALDSISVTPFGLGAVAYMGAGALAGWMEGTIVHAARWLTMAVAFVTSALGVTAFAVIGSVLGQSQMLSAHLLQVVLVVSIWSALLVIPATKACRWAERYSDRFRPAMR